MIDYNKYEKQLHERITPKFVWRVADLSCASLQGDDIRAHIKDCDDAILLAATLGFGTDTLIRQTEAFDMAGAVVLDELANELIERVLDSAEEEIKAKYKSITTRFSPGYGDFPLTVQAELLAILDAGKKIGLYVNDGGLLNPCKSVTAVIGGKK
jgi:hypothetical protein